jgi:hypothetical protein
MLAVLFLAATSVANAQELTTQEVVIKMVQAQQQSRRQAQAYIAEREYHVFKAENRNNNSEITAEISFLPPGDKSFAIKKSPGGMAENVVRKALEHEATMARNPGAGSISPENYDFELVGKSALGEHLCYVLKLAPKRDSKDLIVGLAYVDAERFMVRRAEGKPARNPSWWVKDVTVRVDYNDVNGMWLQTASNATAKVRFAGEYTLNSRHLGMQRAEVSAEVQPPPFGGRANTKRRALRTESSLGVAVGRP